MNLKNYKVKEKNYKHYKSYFLNDGTQLHIILQMLYCTLLLLYYTLLCFIILKDYAILKK